MKQTRLIKMVAVAFGMSIGTAFAQEAATTKIDLDTVTSTGVIMALEANSDFISFQSDTNPAPERYYYTKNTTILDPGGRLVSWSALHADLPATIYYVREGNRAIALKILLRRPGTVYERRGITTSTTTR